MKLEVSRHVSSLTCVRHAAIRIPIEVACHENVRVPFIFGPRKLRETLINISRLSKGDSAVAEVLFAVALMMHDNST